MLRQFATVPRLAARAASPRTAFLTTATATSPLRRAAAAVRPRHIALMSSSQFRCYSSEPAKEGEQKSEQETAAAADGAECNISAEEVNKLREELKAKEKEAIDFKDKFLRSVADFRNLQERSQRDMKSARDFAITQFAKDLVDSVDNLDRALSLAPKKTEAEAEAKEEEPTNNDVANLVDGLRMTETVLLNTLKKHGLERFDPIGDKFDPNEHEATFMTPVPDKEHNTVFHTQQTGFKLNGRILRAAKVGVVNNKK